MYCRNCGEELPATAKFCKKCGTPVQKTAVTGESPKMKKPKKSKIPFILASLLLILFLAVGGLFLWRTISNFKESLEAEPSISQQDHLEEQDDMEEIQQKAEEQSQPENLQEEISEESSLSEDEEISENEEENDEESEYFIPESDSRYLTMDELEGYTEDDCRIARNELYARHGRKFADEFLITYFESKSWYEGTIEPEDFDESVFNEYELANRDLIVEYEKKMGYRG